MTPDDLPDDDPDVVRGMEALAVLRVLEAIEDENNEGER